MKFIKQFLGLVLFLATIAVSGCRLPQNHEDAIADRISNTKNSIVHLTSEVVSCSAFYIGQELFITAAHCLDLRYPSQIVDYSGQTYDAVTLTIDRDRDTGVFFVEDFHGQGLQLWNEQVFGLPKVGSEIISFGYPSYYLQYFTFEDGRILDVVTDRGVKKIVSREISYPGESGGPVISVSNGQVVGLVSSIANQTIELGEKGSTSRDISLLISWSEIRHVLEQALKIK